MNQPSLFGESVAVPPHVSTSATSREAAERIKPQAATLRLAVLECLRSSAGGLTDEEVQLRLGMPGSTQRPRRIELVAMGLVADSGRTRKTASGRSAAVYIARRP